MIFSKTFLIFCFAVGIKAACCFADAGVYGFGVELTAAGAGATNPGTVLFALNNNGGTDLRPTSQSNVTISTSWTGASTQRSATFNLGTFNPGAGDTLVINGGSMLTYANSNNTNDYNDAGGQILNYRVFAGTTAPAGAFTGVTLNADGNPGTGNTRYDNIGAAGNLLAGLAPGTYTLDIFGSASFDSGSYVNYQSNGGSDFGATFTVIPEPTTWVGGAALVGVTLWGARRRLVIAA